MNTNNNKTKITYKINPKKVEKKLPCPKDVKGNLKSFKEDADKHLKLIIQKALLASEARIIKRVEQLLRKSKEEPVLIRREDLMMKKLTVIPNPLPSFGEYVKDK